MSAIEVSAGLLAEVKNYLDITWDDEDADAKLVSQIRRGIAYISGKTGAPATSFESDSEDYNARAQELLLNYVLYDRSGAIDQFKKNYRQDIVGLQILWEVENAAAAEG